MSNKVAEISADYFAKDRVGLVMEFGNLFQEKISRRSLKDTDEVVFVGMQDVNENATIKTYAKLKYSEVKNGFTYFEKNDILVAKITPCFENGKGGFADSIPVQIGFGSTEFHVLRAKNNVDPRYIYFQTKRPKFRNQLEGEMVGSAGHRRVPFASIKKFKLEAEHSYEEQTAIANALSDVDALITSLEKLIDKKRAIKTAAMQQLLTGKKRLPHFDALDNKDDTPRYKQTELGEIPEDWEVKSIGDIFKITAGGDLRKSQFSDEKTHEHAIPIYSNALTNKGLYGFCLSCDYDGNFITITARGGIGHAEERYGRFCAIGRLLVLEPLKEMSCKYLSEYINQYLAFANESTGVPQLTAPQVSQYEVIIPPAEEQIEIANVLTDMDKEIDALKNRLNKTQQIKQGMMQELLTGRTRLV